MRRVEAEAVQAIYSYLVERMREHPQTCPWVIPAKTALWLLREGEAKGALKHIEFAEADYRRLWEAKARG